MSNQELSADVPISVFRLYVPKCVPVSRVTSPAPLLPVSFPLGSSPPPRQGQPTFQMQNLHHRVNTPASQSTPAGPVLGPGISAASTQTAVHQKRLYWCVDRCWSEPAQTRRKIVDVTHLTQDSDLFVQLSSEYTNIRGWVGKLFSWKTCQGVDFIQVCHPPLERPMYCH